MRLLSVWRMLIVGLVIGGAAVAIARPDDSDSKSAKDKPAATKPSVNDFPSPAELVKKMKDLEKKKASQSKVAHFSLTRPIVETSPGFSFFGGDDASLTTRTLLERLNAAGKDKEIKAILITLGAQTSLGFSQAEEIRDALVAIVKSGKPCYVYADGFDTPTYTLASGADHICMLEGGEIEMPGVGLEVTFLKGLFDKVGVKADYVQIGEYKGADEAYTRTEASDELKGELSRLTESLYNEIVDSISHSRHIESQKVRDLIDQSIVMGADAKEAGLVDRLMDQDDIRPMLTKDLGNEIDVVSDYGKPPSESVDFSNPFSLLAAFARKPQASTDKPTVAVISASGVIVDGDGSTGMFSQEEGVGSESMRQAFRTAARDENCKAVVIRIDSPGGSALASEVMWQAARHCAEKKPVIVSVGAMAASGGYYLASAGDKIYADPSAIVGSIGVVGGKFVMKDLYEKLGVHAETFSRGKNAGLFTNNEPWTDSQRKMVTAWMRQTYDQFTRRIMKMRGDKIADIDKVARGRIFLAPQAKKLGLVDEIGGIDDAIAYAAKKANLDEGEYDVRTLPEPKTLADYLTGGGADTAFAFHPKIQIDSVLLQTLAPMLKGPAGRQIQLLQLLADRPVVLMTPFEVNIK
jgi:protease-4